MAVDMFKCFANPAERAQLVKLICDKFPTPSERRVRDFLSELGREFSYSDVCVLLADSKTETARRLNDHARALSKVLRPNPMKADILAASRRLGLKVPDQTTYERLRELLLSFPELWDSNVKKVSKISLGATDDLLMQRISKMLDTSPSGTVSFLLRAFVLSIDSRQVDPIDIFTRTRDTLDAEVQQASAILDLMKFRKD